MAYSRLGDTVKATNYLTLAQEMPRSFEYRVYDELQFQLTEQEAKRTLQAAEEEATAGQDPNEK